MLIDELLIYLFDGQELSSIVATLYRVLDEPQSGQASYWSGRVRTWRKFALLSELVHRAKRVLATWRAAQFRRTPAMSTTLGSPMEEILAIDLAGEEEYNPVHLPQRHPASQF